MPPISARYSYLRVAFWAFGILRSHFKNLQNIKPVGRATFWWMAILVGPIISSLAGFAAVAVLSLAIPDFALMMVGWLVANYVLVRFFGHYALGRVIDAELHKNPRAMAFLSYSSMIVISVGLLPLGWTQLIAVLISVVLALYLGTKPSIQQAADLESVEEESDVTPRPLPSVSQLDQ